MLGRELARVQQRFSETCNRYIEQMTAVKTQLEAARTEAVRQQALAARHTAERDSLREQSGGADKKFGYFIACNSPRRIAQA